MTLHRFPKSHHFLMSLLLAAFAILWINTSDGQTYTPRTYVFENTSAYPRTLTFSYNMVVGDGALVSLTLAPHQKWAINCTIQGSQITVYLKDGLYVNNRIPVLGTDALCTPSGTILIK